MKIDDLLVRHVFCFNEKENGGEAVTLVTNFRSNGDLGLEGVYMDQELSLDSYGRSASFNLSDFTPDLLRKLANQLDSARLEAGDKNKW